LVVPDRVDGRDMLIRLEGEQVGHVLALAVASRLRQLGGLDPVDPAMVGEEEQPVVGGSREGVGAGVLTAAGGAADPIPARPPAPASARGTRRPGSAWRNRPG